MQEETMLKRFTLLLTILLASGLTICYIYLTKEIIAGNMKIAEGQKQLAEGEQMLARGKEKLAIGEQRLSRAKRSYKTLKSTPYLFAPILPIAGVIGVATDKIAGQRIAEGNQLVSQGAKKIKAGEAQLAAGKLQLQHGIARLKWADKIRIACAAGAFVFAFLSIILGLYWRKSLFK